MKVPSTLMSYGGSHRELQRVARRLIDSGIPNKNFGPAFGKPGSKQFFYTKRCLIAVPNDQVDAARALGCRVYFDQWDYIREGVEYAQN